MESLRDLISLVWLREVTMTRSISWWDFLMILVIPDIVHISFPFIWKIVKGKFQPWIVDGWLRTSLCLHLCSSWKLQLDRTKGLFFLQQRDILIIQVFLSVAGMLVIGLALGASFGLCFYIGLSINDVCPIIPFLLLGIGESLKIIPGLREG